MNAAEFNALYPVGTPVVAYPGARPEDAPNGERLITRTRSKAEVLGGHTDVVWVDGHGACINLTHVDVRETVCSWNPVQATTDCDWDRNCPVHGENPTTVAAVAAMGALPMPAGPPQPATPRWHQLRTELISTFSDYMPVTGATKATDLVDRLLVEAGLPASTVEWGVRLVDGGYTAAARDREQALENLAGLNAHDQAAVLVTRTVHRSAWTDAK